MSDQPPPMRIRSSTCKDAFRSDTCWCAGCKRRQQFGADSLSVCVCRDKFNASSLHYQLCKPCKDSFEGHGGRCCSWSWSLNPAPTSLADAPSEIEDMCCGYIDNENTNDPHIHQPSTPDVECCSKILAADVSIDCTNPILHEQEISRRLLWCVSAGLHPANRSVHLAPATPDQDAMLGPHGLPWHPDGSVRPEGLQCRKSETNPLLQPSIHIKTPILSSSGGPVCQAQINTGINTGIDTKVGWACTKCSQWVHWRPRAFHNGPEPDHWWWCVKCRGHVEQKSQQNKNISARSRTLKRARATDDRQSTLKFSRLV